MKTYYGVIKRYENGQHESTQLSTLMRALKYAVQPNNFAKSSVSWWKIYKVRNDEGELVAQSATI